MKTFTRYNKGFTIIETLVAVTILMISIAGPLTIAHKSFVAAVYAHDQVTASYLAQDAMEYIKNIRDTNQLKSTDSNPVDWLEGLRGCIDPARCGIDTLADTNKIVSSHFLYPTDNGYTPNRGANPNWKFQRYFYIIANSRNPQEVKVVVYVTWFNGTVSNEVRYESALFNVLK